MNVAILDDHQLLAEALASSIQSHDPSAEVNCFNRWEDMEAHLAGNACDLVFLDMRLTECLGVELIPVIHQMSCNTRIVVVSAFANGELINKCLNLGIVGFISKTSPIEVFHRGLAAILAGKTFFDSIDS